MYFDFIFFMSIIFNGFTMEIDQDQLSPFEVVVENNSSYKSKVVFYKNYNNKASLVELVLPANRKINIGKIYNETSISAVNYGSTTNLFNIPFVIMGNPILNERNSISYEQMNVFFEKNNKRIIYLSWNQPYSSISFSNLEERNIQCNDLVQVNGRINDLNLWDLQEQLKVIYSDENFFDVLSDNDIQNCRHALAYPEPHDMQNWLKREQEKEKLLNLHHFLTNQINKDESPFTETIIEDGSMILTSVDEKFIYSEIVSLSFNILNKYYFGINN